MSNLVVDDEAKVIKCSDAKGLKLYHTVRKIDKSAVKTAIREGKAVSGARLVTGEESYYKVEKALIDNARENILSS